MIDKLKMSIKEYSIYKNVSTQSVYQSIKMGKIDCIVEGKKKYIIVEKEVVKEVAEVTNEVDKVVNNELIRLQIRNEILENENILIKSYVEEIKKEKEELKYQVKDKDLKINQLLEKMESLNDRVIGLIEWKSKSFWSKLWNK